MAKNRVLLVLEIALLLVFISSLVSCGGSRASSLATPAATASHRLNTGSPGLPLYCPVFLALDQQGNIYVGDADYDKGAHRARIAKLSPTGQLLSEWHVFTVFPPGRAWGPDGIAVDASGTIYVADGGDNTIKKLSPTGQVLATWGKKGSAPGEVSWPEGVAVDAQGNVYVADFYNSRIQKFSSTGTLLAVFGNAGSSTERLKNPVGLRVDDQSNVYVADLRNHRIVKFSADGKFLVAWSQADSIPFSSARDIAVDRERNIYVEDGRNQRLVKLSPTGQVLAIWKPSLFKDGMFGVVVDRQENVYVVSQTGTGSVVKLSPSGAILSIWPASCHWS